MAAHPKPLGGLTRRPLALIQSKLERILHSSGNRALERYRHEVVAIIDTLDTINRDTQGLRKHGRLGDVELD